MQYKSRDAAVLNGAQTFLLFRNALHSSFETIINQNWVGWRKIFPKWNQMFAIWDSVDDTEWHSESSEEYSSVVDTANMVVNTAAAISVLLYSFIMTSQLCGLTFFYRLMPQLVGLQRNKVLYTTYHKHNQLQTLWASEGVYKRVREEQETKQKQCHTEGEGALE